MSRQQVSHLLIPFATCYDNLTIHASSILCYQLYCLTKNVSNIASVDSICKREILADMEVDKVVNVDENYVDPQFCATIACDIYKHLRASEV